MPSTAIWLNRNYATAVHLINQIRHNPEGRPVTIYGSHQDMSSPMLTACDRIFVESTLTGRDYADYALQFCVDHGIKVFLPVHEQYAITLQEEQFRAAGVALIAPGPAAVALLDDKAATYAAVGDDLGLVPPWREVDSADTFEAALAELLVHGKTVVVKPARGVGADGVRMLTDNPPTLADMIGPVNYSATILDYVLALKTAEAQGVPVPSLLVMPYLSAPEISVDVLAHDGETMAAVPRSKVGRERYLDASAEVIHATRHLVRKFSLDGLVNVQFRQWEGRPVLLEINTRPSGGLYQTQLAQVNLPWAAVRQALGEPALPLRPVLGAHYVTVPTMLALRG